MLAFWSVVRYQDIGPWRRQEDCMRINQQFKFREREKKRQFWLSKESWFWKFASARRSFFVTFWFSHHLTKPAQWYLLRCFISTRQKLSITTRRQTIGICSKTDRLIRTKGQFSAHQLQKVSGSGLPCRNALKSTRALSGCEKGASWEAPLMVANDSMSP